MVVKTGRTKIGEAFFRAWSVPVVAIGILLAAVSYYENSDTLRFQHMEKIYVVSNLSTLRARLEGVINGNLQSVTGLITEKGICSASEKGINTLREG